MTKPLAFFICVACSATFFIAGCQSWCHPGLSPGRDATVSQTGDAHAGSSTGVASDSKMAEPRWQVMDSPATMPS